MDSFEKMEIDGRKALAGKLNLISLDLHLQAKIDVSKNADNLDAFELLLRGESKAGAVAPCQIVTEMRRRGFEREFAEVLTLRAIGISRTLQTRALCVPVALNFDEPDFLIDGLPEAVIDLLAAHSPDRRAVEIEVTEQNRRRDDIDRVIRALGLFADKGMRIWIDDAMFRGNDLVDDLRRMSLFPVNGIKLDKSIIDQAPEDAARALRQARGFAEQLGIERIVAEGIETPTQLARCKDNHIPILQGFHFHRPQPLESAIRAFA